MATPLVLSVHSIVSFDFAISQLPGWHTTIFPPYFVAGAIFSGFAMVLTLMIPLRSWFKLEHLITTKHLENMAKVILLTGTLVGYAYGMEFFIAWYSGNPYESFLFINRAFGDYSWAYWTMMSCNVISPQFMWFKKLRRSPAALFILSIFVNIGMWFERFVIVVTSLHRDFLPSSWGYFVPTLWDVATFIGSFGLFFTLFCLFLRFLPVIAIAEVKGVMPQANPHYKAKKKRKRHITKSAVGVVESRDGTSDSVDHSEESEPSVSTSVKVVVSGANKLEPEPGPDQGGGDDKAEAEADADSAKAADSDDKADDKAAEAEAADDTAADDEAADVADAADDEADASRDKEESDG